MANVIERIYTPSKTGKAFMLSDKFVRVIMGPIGSGKSVLCCMEIVRRCKQQKKSPDGKRRSRWVIVRNTLPQLKDTTIKTFFDWIVPGAAGKWKESDKTFFLRFGDVEAEILFRPLDTPEDVGRVLSLELTGAWFNECKEIPQEIMDAVQGRCKRYPSTMNGGYTWSGVIADTNPPDEDSWWHDQMEINTPANWGVFKQPSGVSPEAENRANLAPDYYEELMIGKAPEWIDVFVHGKYGKSRSGKPVYRSTFNSDIHVAKESLFPIPHTTILIGMDFGLTPAAVIGQLLTTGQLAVLEEVTAFDMGVERFLETKLGPVLRSRYAGLPTLIIGDPSGAYRVGTNEGTTFRIIKKAGYKVIPASSDRLPPRLGAVEHFLSLLVDGGRPAYIMDPVRCPMLLSGYKSHYRFEKKRKGATTEYKETPDKNDWSHVHDGNQYLCMYAKAGHIMTNAANPLTNRPLPKQVGYTPGVW